MTVKVEHMPYDTAADVLALEAEMRAALVARLGGGQ